MAVREGREALNLEVVVLNPICKKFTNLSFFFYLFLFYFIKLLFFIVFSHVFTKHSFASVCKKKNFRCFAFDENSSPQIFREI